jgi:hypothetical protein
VLPVLGREVEVDEEPLLVLPQRRDGLGYLKPKSSANLSTASRACSRVSAYITSWSWLFAWDCSRFGSLSRLAQLSALSR